jgi:hypothetical protein
MSTFVRACLKIGVALFLVAALVAPASGGEPSVRRDDTAYADWFLRTAEKGRLRWLGAYVSRNTTIVGGSSWFSGAGFVKGWCTREKTKRHISISCMSTDFVRADVDKDFEMSPLADEAVLRSRHKGRTNVVRWKGSPTSGGLYGYSEYCATFSEGENEPEDEGEGQGTGIMNPADAEGSLFGHRFDDPRQARWPSLSTGVVVTTCSFRTVEYDAPSDTLRVTFKIPR